MLLLIGAYRVCAHLCVTRGIANVYVRAVTINPRATRAQ